MVARRALHSHAVPLISFIPCLQNHLVRIRIHNGERFFRHAQRKSVIDLREASDPIDISSGLLDHISNAAESTTED
jgi:hypothetical protein